MAVWLETLQLLPLFKILLHPLRYLSVSSQPIIGELILLDCVSAHLIDKENATPLTLNL